MYCGDIDCTIECTNIPKCAEARNLISCKEIQEKLVLLRRMPSELSSIQVFGKIDNKYVIVCRRQRNRYFNNVELEKNLCNQLIAYENNCAINLLGYMHCTPREFITLHDNESYISLRHAIENDEVKILDAYYNFVKVIWTVNRLGIHHNNLKISNLIVLLDDTVMNFYRDGYSVKYLLNNFVKSEKYEMKFENGALDLGSFSDLSSFTTNFLRAFRESTDEDNLAAINKIYKLQLIDNQIWSDIVTEFYYYFMIIPDGNALARMISNLVSGRTIVDGIVPRDHQAYTSISSMISTCNYFIGGELQHIEDTISCDLTDKPRNTGVFNFLKSYLISEELVKTKEETRRDSTAVSKTDFNKIEVGKLISDDVIGKLYGARFGTKKLYLHMNNYNYKQVICSMRRAGDINIAPKLYNYWNCSGKSRNIVSDKFVTYESLVDHAKINPKHKFVDKYNMITEYIGGLNLVNFFKSKITDRRVTNIFIKLLTAVYRYIYETKHISIDMVPERIIVNNNDVKFIYFIGELNDDLKDYDLDKNISEGNTENLEKIFSGVNLATNMYYKLLVKSTEGHRIKLSDFINRYDLKSINGTINLFKHFHNTIKGLHPVEFERYLRGLVEVETTKIMQTYYDDESYFGLNSELYRARLRLAEAFNKREEVMRDITQYEVRKSDLEKKIRALDIAKNNKPFLDEISKRENEEIIKLKTERDNELKILELKNGIGYYTDKITQIDIEIDTLTRELIKLKSDELVDTINVLNDYIRNDERKIDDDSRKNIELTGKINAIVNEKLKLLQDINVMKSNLLDARGKLVPELHKLVSLENELRDTRRELITLNDWINKNNDAQDPQLIVELNDQINKAKHLETHETKLMEEIDELKRNFPDLQRVQGAPVVENLPASSPKTQLQETEHRLRDLEYRLSELEKEENKLRAEMVNDDKINALRDNIMKRKELIREYENRLKSGKEEILNKEPRTIHYEWPIRKEIIAKKSLIDEKEKERGIIAKKLEDLERKSGKVENPRETYQHLVDAINKDFQKKQKEIYDKAEKARGEIYKEAEFGKELVINSRSFMDKLLDYVFFVKNSDEDQADYLRDGYQLEIDKINLDKLELEPKIEILDKNLDQLRKEFDEISKNYTGMKIFNCEYNTTTRFGECNHAEHKIIPSLGISYHTLYNILYRTTGYLNYTIYQGLVRPFDQDYQRALIKNLYYKINMESLCAHNICSKHKISPQILSYWNCDEQNRAIIIFKDYEGYQPLHYIKNHLEDIYFKALETILIQNIILNITNGNINSKTLFVNFPINPNLIKQEVDVNFIDYEFAQIYHNYVESFAHLNVVPEIVTSDDENTNLQPVNNLFVDLVMLNNTFEKHCRGTPFYYLSNFIIDKKLNSASEWNRILKKGSIFRENPNKVPAYIVQSLREVLHPK